MRPSTPGLLLTKTESVCGVEDIGLRCWLDISRRDRCELDMVGKEKRGKRKETSGGTEAEANE